MQRLAPPAAVAGSSATVRYAVLVPSFAICALLLTTDLPDQRSLAHICCGLHIVELFETFDSEAGCLRLQWPVQIEYAAADAICLLAVLENLASVATPAAYPASSSPATGRTAGEMAANSAAPAANDQTETLPHGADAFQHSTAADDLRLDALSITDPRQSQAERGNAVEYRGDAGQSASSPIESSDERQAQPSDTSQAVTADAASCQEGVYSVAEVVRWWAERLEMSGNTTLVRVALYFCSTLSVGFHLSQRHIVSTTAVNWLCYAESTEAPAGKARAPADEGAAGSCSGRDRLGCASCHLQGL